MSRSRPSPLVRSVAVVAAALVATGCQVAPAGTAAPRPTFRMQAAAELPGAGGAVAPQAVPGVAEAPATAAGTGALIVRFDHVLAIAAAARRRALLVAAGDVDAVTIRLTGAGVDRLETVTAAMLASGSTSFTFTGLPAVELVVTIQAFDAAGVKLAEDVRKTSVSPGAATTVDANTLVGPAPAAPAAPAAPGGGSGGSSGGSGGGGTSPADGLRAAITLVAPAPVRKLAPTARYFQNRDELDVRSMVVAKDGALWVAIGAAQGFGAKRPEVHRRPAAGAFAETPVMSSFVNWDYDGILNLVPDVVRGGVFAGDLGASGAPVARFQADGTLDAATEIYLDAGPSPDLAIDPQGRAWLAVDGRPGHWDAASGEVTVGPYQPGAGERVDRMVFDGQGYLWVAGRTWEHDLDANGIATASRVVHGWVRCIDPIGQVVAAHDVGGAYTTDVALAPDGDLWFLTGDGYGLRKASRTGAVVATAASGAWVNRITVGPDGDVWGFRGTPPRAYLWNWFDMRGAGSGGTDAFIPRFAPDGTLRAYYHAGVGADVTELAITSDGKLWAGTGLNGLLEIPIDLPFAP